MRVASRTAAHALTVLAAAAALAACATPHTNDVGQAMPPTDVRGYDCNGRPVDPVAFAAAQPASELPAEQLAIVEGATDDAGQPIGIAAHEWIVVASSGGQIHLMRRLSEGDPALEPEHDWQHVTIGDVGSAGWMLTSSATCALSYDLSPLTATDVALDPADPPDPSSVNVPLLVTERACNSGQDAEGRVRLVELIEAADAVTVMIGVDRAGMDAAYDCQGNPPTRFAVTLAEPLGERAILNGNLVEPRPIERQPAVAQ